jgi:hypothetical protein
MACHSIPEPGIPEPAEMNRNSKTWLQLYVDAVMEKDPYKRLALVQQLRKMPKHDESDDSAPEPVIRSVKKPKLVRRH